MKKLNDDNFLTTISNGISVVKFSAEWCAPCRTLEPVLEKLEEVVKVPVYEINIDESTKIVELFGIRAVPTVILFKNGEVVGNALVGARTLTVYQELVEKIKNSSN